MKTTYTTGQVAKICDVTQATVWNWIQNKKLSAYQTPGGRFFIRSNILFQFLKKYSIPIPDDLRESGNNRILVVDDEKGVIDVIVRRFSFNEGDYEIETAMDGYEAGKKIARFKPDVVILDIKMPGIDGYHVCKDIKNNPLTAGIKVIAITGLDEDSAKRILECGADACFRKPLSLDELKKMVDLFLNPESVFAEPYN